jgi:two-component system, chemotaxis family, chemotaxis protein CheY
MPTTVLVVDDAVFMRTMIRDILAREGYAISEAGNGLEAVQKYSDERPDLVTLDITMPEMDGLEALRAIREIDPHARVLMVSAMGQQQMILEALEGGALDFIVKPFKPTKVVETVRKCLAST